MTDHSEMHDGLWLSVTDLAKRKGVRKSTISEKVKRLVEAGRLTTRSGGRGKVNLINVAQYDLAIGDIGDGAREQGAETKKEIAGGSTLAGDEVEAAKPSRESARYRDEQTREKAYAADLKYLELEQRRGNLIIVAEVDDVVNDMCAKILDVINGLMSLDTELTDIAVRQGEPGMRVALKRISRQIRTDLVAATKEMAVTARARASSAANKLPPLNPEKET